jgi:hypothetical protein
VNHGKFLLCMPRGGLNDTLCQISKCWKYSIEWDRTLCIDTTESGLQCDFWDLFDIRPNARSPKIIHSRELNDLAGLQLSMRPPYLRDLPWPDRVSADYDQDSGQIISKINGLPITFDFKTDHPEDILVHCACGGGRLSYQLIRQICLSRNTADKVRGSLSELPLKYIGVHIRNTDLACDYKTFLVGIHNRLIGEDVLICSDDAEVIGYAKDYLKDSRVISHEFARGRPGQPIHSLNLDRTMGYQRSGEALTDLVSLARAQRIFFPHVKTQTKETWLWKLSPRSRMFRGWRGFFNPGPISGFSLLAFYLNKRRNVLRRFLS